MSFEWFDARGKTIAKTSGKVSFQGTKDLKGTSHGSHV